MKILHNWLFDKDLVLLLFLIFYEWFNFLQKVTKNFHHTLNFQKIMAQNYAKPFLILEKQKFIIVAKDTWVT